MMINDKLQFGVLHLPNNNQRYKEQFLKVLLISFL